MLLCELVDKYLYTVLVSSHRCVVVLPSFRNRIHHHFARDENEHRQRESKGSVNHQFTAHKKEGHVSKVGMRMTKIDAETTTQKYESKKERRRGQRRERQEGERE